MITLLTGAPGTGKTAALVSLLAEFQKNRTIFVNGIPDLAIDHQELEDPTKWHETVPDGCIIVIDEVQRIWRPRGPGQKVPPDIAALETHRHRGIDFYVVTQGPRLVDSNVRALVGRHIHLRDIGFLGRWWYEWPECSDQCATSWKQAPIKKRYRLPKAIFTQYKSASVHIKPVRSFPWVVVVMLMALLITAGLAWKSYTSINAKLSPVKPETVALNAPGQIGHTSVDSAAPPPYDITAFIPRVSGKPESAPAYDFIRAVTAMPTIIGGMCMKGVCKCFTQQITDSGLTSSECKDWLANRPFDPYKLASPSGITSAPSSALETPPPRQPDAGELDTIKQIHKLKPA